MNVSIIPVLVFPATAVTVSFADFYCVPDTTLNCQYQLLDSGNAVLSVGRINLTSGQYTGWAGSVDDNVYLPACFALNLGLTITGSA